MLINNQYMNNYPTPPHTPKKPSLFKNIGEKIITFGAFSHCRRTKELRWTR